MGFLKTLVGGALGFVVGGPMGAAIGAGIGGGLDGADAQNKASSNALNAQNYATDKQYQMYQQQRDDNAPYQKMGVDGITAYNDFKANPTAYLNSPAYQWQQAQVDKNMNRQLSARGRSNSTYGMNSLANAYGNLGAQEYQNAYNRMLDPIKIGQGAAGQAGQASQNMSSAYGQAASNLGNIYTQQGNNRASLYSGLGALPMQGLAAYQGMKNNQAMTNYFNRQP